MTRMKQKTLLKMRHSRNTGKLKAFMEDYVCKSLIKMI